MRRNFTNNVNMCELRVQVLVCLCLAALVAAKDSVVTMGNKETNEDDILVLLKNDGLIPVPQNVTDTKTYSVVRFNENFEVKAPQPKRYPSYVRESDMMLEMETDFLMPAEPFLNRQKRQVVAADLVEGSGNMLAEIRGYIGLLFQFTQDLTNPSSALYTVMKVKAQKVLTAIFKRIPNFDHVTVTGFSSDGGNGVTNVEFTVYFTNSGDRVFVAAAVQKMFDSLLFSAGNTFLGIMAQVDPVIYDSSDNTKAAICYLCPSSFPCVTVPGTLATCGTRSSAPSSDLFPWGMSQRDNFVKQADDSVSPPIFLDVGFPFDKLIHHKVYMGTNGILSFGSPYNPTGLMSVGVPGEFIICTYCVDIDLRNAGSIGNAFYQVYTSSNPRDKIIVDRATNEVHKHTPDSAFEANTVLVATWDRVPPYKDESGVLAAERSTFQTVLITDGKTGYMMSFYEQGSMKWNSQQYKNVVIGYSSSTDLVEPSIYSRMETRPTMDTVSGNTGIAGVWLYKVGEKKVGLNYAQKCYSWYLRNLGFKKRLLERYSQMPSCPCSSLFLDFQRIFMRRGKRGKVTCYDIGPFFGSSGKSCCYNKKGSLITSMPLSGNFQRFSSWMFPVKHKKQDVVPKSYCCEKSSLCSLFYELRPSDTLLTCSRQSRIRWALLFGDPHITTLDGRQYTFNGLGEYTMMEINADNFTFVLQGRTGRMETQKGLVNATVFTAFSASNSDGGKLHVEMDRTKTELVIYGNGRDYTAYYARNYNFPVVTPELLLEKVGNSSVVATFSNKITLNITLSLKVLTISVAVPEIYKTLPVGLLGNFNGNPDDDFKKKTGEQLPATANERDLFDMGQTWQIPLNSSASTMFYQPGYSPSDFVDPSFQPVFTDEATQEQRNQAIQICGSDLKACIYDYIVTGDKDFALQTKDVLVQSDTRKIVNENEAPYINGTTVVNALIGNNSTLQFTAFDDNTTSPTFVLLDQPDYSFTFDNQTGTAVWLPVNTTPVAISLTAMDNAGLQAAPLEVTIMLCTGCSGQGTCDYTTPRTVASSAADQKFQIAVCNCNTGWAGDECNQNFNSCIEFPCAIGQICTDLSPDEEEVRGVGYNCSACSPGFEANDRKCQDIDECQKSNICPENSTCENSISSYKCVCNSGFRMSRSGQCIDIDECIEQSYNCSQVCNNFVGGYSCSCFDGYSLWTDNAYCNQTTVPDLCKEANCSQGCTIVSGNAECFCYSGYRLESDQKTCTNINECSMNLCAQKCTDSEGSYTCSCYDGFRLAADKLACEQCPFPQYGPSCSLTCNCHGHASSCDPVHGCVCVTGWVGTNCTQDIDECTQSPGICGNRFICTNTEGSYQCTCPSGFENNGTECVDIDECGSGLDNCTQDCTNIVGSFICSCREGYRKEGFSNCIDIDECKSGAAACEQICQNVEGSYNCLCHYGYYLKNDRKQCEKVSDPCQFYSHLNCSHYCTVVDKQAQCGCNFGYKLATDKHTCIDINECTSTDASITKCTDTCTNTNGGFTCSCPAGKKLENDQRTCADCDPDHWGDNCTNECNCDPIGSLRCNAVTGCECKEGWVGTRCENDRDECSSSTASCPANSVCKNLPGSYQCECRTGYQNSSNGCIDLNECLASTDNVCDHFCNNTEGSYTCSCRTGFVLEGKGKCVDIDECALNQHNCEQKCRNTFGGFTCECYEGFVLNHENRHTCTVVTECNATMNSTCEQGCRVVDTVQQCFCKSGYTLNPDKVNCTDINECDLNNTCSQNCTNSDGGYTCSCMDGYKLETDKVTCRACDSGFYGAGCSQLCQCNVSNTESCNSVDGSCTCLSGWNGTTCENNINECLLASTSCGTNSVCRDTPGSFVCECEVGFVRTASQCTACDGKSNYGKDCSQTCTCLKANTDLCDTKNGTCYCKAGWEGPNCEKNIDECARNSNLCSLAHEHCLDNNGSYSCVCDSGYTDSTGSCVDVNECLDANLNTCNFACNNTDGGYLCFCPAGYTGEVNNCTDVNECNDNNGGCEQICTNSAGSFVCSCNHGYTVNTTKPESCSDIDECLDSTLHNCTTPSEVCVNTQGGFTCDCAPGYSSINGACKADRTTYLVTLKLDISDKDSVVNRGSSDPEYIALTKLIADAIYKLLKPIVGDSLLPIKVGNLATGSVEAGVTVEIDNSKTNRTASKLAKALDYLLTVGKLNINGTDVKILQAKYGAVPVTEPMTMCQVLEVIEACPKTEECKEVEQEPRCVPIEEAANKLPLIIGLGVGIPAFLLLLIVIIFLCCVYCRRKKASSQRDSSEDRHNAFRSVFAGALPTKGSWGASRFQMYSPDTLSDVASTRSGASSGRLLRSKGAGKGRSDFLDTPWYDNSSAPDRSTSRGQYPTPRGADDAPTSNFSWEYMFRVLEPLRNFEIQRPVINPEANRVYKGGRTRPDSMA